jgi:predicted transcriptional regulator
MADNQTTERRGPGRPRVPEVVQRDEVVLKHVTSNGPIQVRDIAEALDIKKSSAYLSLWRLRREGKVVYNREGASRMWAVV